MRMNEAVANLEKIQKAIGIAEPDFSSIFNRGCGTMQILHIAQWHLAKSKQNPNLRLPPIQRSIVWTNEQIINYWDSLLRGYLAGTMLVNKVNKPEQSDKCQGLDDNGMTVEMKEDDYQLFDGQQRISAILLGFGLGQMKDTRKLWVDLGTVPKSTSGLRFQLRLTSTGQPFGYKPNAPNEKCELADRQKKWEEWLRISKSKDPFPIVTGEHLIDGACPILFSDIFDCLKRGKEGAVEELANKHTKCQKQDIEDFIMALEEALKSEVILQQVKTETVSKLEDRIRFFTRLGQGGTRLTEDELTYSIIKDQYPHIRERMKKITKKAGRFAGEVDLVLAAMRVAKTLAPWKDSKPWEVINRPNPKFVSELSKTEEASGEYSEVLKEFLKLIPLPNDQKQAMLEEALLEIRKALLHAVDHHPKGLPAILLGRLPHELVDVLILFAVKRGTRKYWEGKDRDILTAFTLHWLLFVKSEDKAAWIVFDKVREKKDWEFSEKSIQELIDTYEEEGIAHYLPREKDVDDLQRKLNDEDPKINPNHKLRTWGERFTAADRGSSDDHKPGETLRVLSTNRELIMRALMWLQRDYIVKEFPNYDPTSDRDEDLPIDLDHIVPYDVFGFHWGKRQGRLEEKLQTDNFRWQRGVVGNSLGNFRWLASSSNRKRGKGEYTPIENNDDLVSEPAAWNEIIPQNKEEQRWSRLHIAKFQYLIDQRTIALYKTLWGNSGIANIVRNGTDGEHVDTVE